MADDGTAPPLHLLQRSERQTKSAAYPWGALHATEGLGPGASFRPMKVGSPDTRDFRLWHRRQSPEL
jgi:hypothetical protein